MHAPTAAKASVHAHAPDNCSTHLSVIPPAARRTHIIKLISVGRFLSCEAGPIMQLQVLARGDPDDGDEEEVGSETGADEDLRSLRRRGVTPDGVGARRLETAACCINVYVTTSSCLLDSSTFVKDIFRILTFRSYAFHFQTLNYSQRDNPSSSDKQIANPGYEFALNLLGGCNIKSSQKERTNPPELTSNAEMPKMWVYTQRPSGDVKTSDCASDSWRYDAAIHISSIVYFLPLMLLILCRLGVPSAILVLTTSWTPRTAILVLYLGVSSASAHPIHQLHPVTLTDRQTSTIWTVPLKGWPNTGYCAMLQFGINKPQKVRIRANDEIHIHTYISAVLLQFCMIVDTGSSNTAVAATPDKALGGSEFFNVNR